MKPSLLRVALVVAGVVAVVVLAFAALRGSSRSAPENLAVGDCIDIPTSASIAAVPRLSCTESHGGEVFHVFDAPGTAAAYPSDPEWGELIYPVCDPAFEAYTGTAVETRTDIDYVYFVPTADRWADGDRRVTCFIKSLDGQPLLRSYRKAG